MSNYFVILVIAPFVFAQPNYKNIPVTRWVSPDGSKPTTYANWRAGSSVWCRTFEHGLVYLGPPLGSQVELLVNAGLWVNCESTLTHYVRDLEDENWTVRVDTVRQGSAEDIRSLLQSLPNLEGVVMVGDLPVPWFQMLDDFEQNDTIDGYEEFPVDLFYTDLDGFWSDSLHYEKIDGRDTLVAGQDGIYDQHSGDRAPEIWLGRVTASPLGDEQQLVEHYFDKAHRYRRGELALNVRALIYVDDDWARWAPD